jgi:hypothetical protein
VTCGERDVGLKVTRVRVYEMGLGSTVWSVRFRVWRFRFRIKSFGSAV